MKNDINTITELFKEILDLNEVTTESDFFEEGGDSFDALRLMSSLDENLPIVTIFENPTPQKLNDYIKNKDNIKSPRLIPLKSNQDLINKSDIAFIGVPFGGGDPTSYKDIFKYDDKIMVYGVDFGDVNLNELSLESDFKYILKEINSINKKKIIIYGHCAGGATATYLTAKLDSENVYLMIGASTPIKDPDKAVEESRITSNEDWGRYLKSIGGLDGLNDTEINGMLKRGRRDHIISTEMYRKLLEENYKKPFAKIILGDSDPSIKSTERAVDDWGRFLKINDETIIKNGGHYFLKTHLSDVENTIYEYI